MSLLELSNSLLAHLPDAVPFIDDPGSAAPPGETGEKIGTVISWVTWIATAVCAVGIIIAGGMMAVGQRRGEGGEHAGRLAWVVAGAILITGAFQIVNAIV
jgi:type IV secretory pathway VirB2 component (pilin)